jgi:CubicO group peptidase (beta-lactamase class C family)
MKLEQSVTRRHVIVGLGGLAVSACGHTQQTSSNLARPGGSLSKPVAKMTDLRSLLAPHVGDRGVPGLAALLLRDGGEQVATLGVQTAGQAAPVARDTIFRVASMTKPITAVATLLLVEDGKLNLDEPVERLLPELANRSVLKHLDSPLTDVEPAKRAITVRDLLTFQMGFGIVLAPQAPTRFKRRPTSSSSIKARPRPPRRPRPTNGFAASPRCL